MHQLYLGTGGNLGNKQANFDKVYTHIQNELGTILKCSQIHETAPWGFESDDLFWNQVLFVETQFTPHEVLERIAKIEAVFGRERTAKGYASREMDIDILYFDELILETETLTIPHPQIANRLFVLVPLAEIAPDFVHPVLKLTSVEMLALCGDKSEISKLKNQKFLPK
jgi:2-amino-4-hydroxy-6-hydroxymethyldihydropteridine diphosphokinase